MIAEYTAGKAMLAVWAAVCAWQDMKTMSIDHKAVAAGLAMVAAGLGMACSTPFYGMDAVSAAGPAGGAASDMSMRAAAAAFMRAASGMLPGTVILIFSRITGQIGAGDGLYFIIVGAAVGLGDVLLLFMTALFLNALAGVGMVLILAVRGLREPELWQRRLPFLPAASLVLIWMLARVH